VILDSTRLGEAVAEMNRYSPFRWRLPARWWLTFASAALSGLGNLAVFAQAIATTYRLQVLDKPDRIVLSVFPSATYQ